VPRGDVRVAVLHLLTEQPMHGYQLMQAISDRSGGRWAPSPGAVYPTLNQLEDEGLVAISNEGGRKLATLTESGRDAAAREREARPDPFASADGAGPTGPNYRQLLERVMSAAKEVARTGTDEQVEAGAQILREARRSLYLVLADGDVDADGGVDS
jgi:DNA-binding PadR family transcriptional regulator